jgi:hypothetical protein
MRRKAIFCPVAASFQGRNPSVGEAVVKRRTGSAMSEDSLLERVTAAAEERQLSQNSLLL